MWSSIPSIHHLALACHKFCIWNRCSACGTGTWRLVDVDVGFSTPLDGRVSILCCGYTFVTGWAAWTGDFNCIMLAGTFTDAPLPNSGRFPSRHRFKEGYNSIMYKYGNDSIWSYCNFTAIVLTWHPPHLTFKWWFGFLHLSQTQSPLVRKSLVPPNPKKPRNRNLLVRVNEISKSQLIKVATYANFDTYNSEVYWLRFRCCSYGMPRAVWCPSLILWVHYISKHSNGYEQEQGEKRHISTHWYQYTHPSRSTIVLFYTICNDGVTVARCSLALPIRLPSFPLACVSSLSSTSSDSLYFLHVKSCWQTCNSSTTHSFSRQSCSS